MLIRARAFVVSADSTRLHVVVLDKRHNFTSGRPSVDFCVRGRREGSARAATTQTRSTCDSRGCPHVSSKRMLDPLRQSSQSASRLFSGPDLKAGMSGERVDKASCIIPIVVYGVSDDNCARSISHSLSSQSSRNSHNQKPKKEERQVYGFALLIKIIVITCTQKTTA